MGRASRRKKESRRDERVRRLPSINDSKYTHTFQAPELLVAAGPTIPARIAVPTALEEALRAAGHAVPAPVSGQLLVDTGASGTCISEVAAAALNLRPLRVGDSFGAGGQTKMNVYRAKILLVVGKRGKLVEITWELEVHGVVDLEKCMAGMPITLTHSDGSVSQPNPIGLLGRDVLRHAELSYSGPRAVIEVAFDLASMERAPGFSRAGKA